MFATSCQLDQPQKKSEVQLVPHHQHNPWYLPHKEKRLVSATLLRWQPSSECFVHRRCSTRELPCDVSASDMQQMSNDFSKSAGLPLARNTKLAVHKQLSQFCTRTNKRNLPRTGGSPALSLNKLRWHGSAHDLFRFYVFSSPSSRRMKYNVQCANSIRSQRHQSPQILKVPRQNIELVFV